MTAPMPQAEYPAPPASNSGRGFTIAGGVCGVIALVLIPPLFGILGLVFGIVADRKGDRAGRYVAIGSVLAMIVGMVVGALVLHSLRS